MGDTKSAAEERPHSEFARSANPKNGHTLIKTPKYSMQAEAKNQRP